jgi:hypothetical protein
MVKCYAQKARVSETVKTAKKLLKLPLTTPQLCILCSHDDPEARLDYFNYYAGN